jgi:cell division protein FtsW
MAAYVSAERGTDAAATKRRAGRRYDPLLLGAVAALVGLGVLVTYTASYSVGYTYFGEGDYFLKRQLIWMAIGLAAAVFAIGVDYRTWRRYAAPAMAVTVVALILLVFFGSDRFGSARWVSGGSFQPSELAKMALVVYIAHWLAAKRDQLNDFSLGFVPFGVITGLVCGLVILQPNFSTAVLLAIVASAMFFVAGAPVKHLLQAGGVALVLLVGVMLQAPYRIARWEVFLDPESDPTGGGFQILQSLGAISRGGLLGVGLGNGQNKHLLPAAHTDGVFAVLAEEMGTLGGLAVLILFVIIAWRGLRVATGAPDLFGSLLAVGITTWIVLQAAVNMAVVTAVVPFTGIPMPWISFGGSSFVACTAAAGLLLNISGHIDDERLKIHPNVDIRWRNGRSRLSRAHRARRLADGDL